MYNTICYLLFSHSAVLDSLQSRGLHHARLPCPSPSPGACSSSCPLSWWCYLTISFCAVLFSFCLPSFPASVLFLFFQWVSSSYQVTKLLDQYSASVLPMNIQGWFPLGLTGLISLQFKGLSRVFSSSTSRKHQFSSVQPESWPNSHIFTWLLGKP